MGRGARLPAVTFFPALIFQPALKLKKLQARLFPVLAKCHGNLLDPLISIYQLCEADSHFLLGHITHFYYMNQYKEVGPTCRYALALETPLQGKPLDPGCGVCVCVSFLLHKGIQGGYQYSCIHFLAFREGSCDA